MRYLFNVIFVLSLSVLGSCMNPNRDYKLTKKQKIRIHQGYEYRKNKIDKKLDVEKEAWRENDKARLEHNRKVAASKDPKKKMQVTEKAAPFGF